MSTSPAQPPARTSAPFSRRHFLLTTTAAGAAGAGAALVAAGPAGAAVRVDRHPAFTAAGRAYGVPPALLAAVSYAQTRWQHHDGRPSASLGYGPMHLVDGTALAAARARAGKEQSADVVDTLGDAVAASGLPADQVRTDADANVRAAAALLAQHQADAGRPVGVDTDPADWYATVASTGGLTTAASRLDLADTVLTTLRQGGDLRLADGQRLELPPTSVGTPRAQRRALTGQVRESRRTQSARASGDGPVDAPPGLDVEWVPAPYEQYGESSSAYGNHDLAFRPDAPAITHLVIHDTEATYDTTIQLVTDPTYVSWQYSLRSSDGHIAQHLAPSDVGWHAGNWYMNSHSIGLEHEGFAAEGPAWYSEPMYRRSARLVRHLCETYDIPLDRAHVIGHDQVPGITTAYIPGMHWDPGPFWDWEHYFDLMGRSLKIGTTTRPVAVGDVVRILPGFVGNTQPLTGCEDPGDTCGGASDTNFVTLRKQPSADAALVDDPGLHQDGSPSTTKVADIGARAAAGTEYVVAAVDGDWTAVWFLGQQAWFLNPPLTPTARPVKAPLGKVRAKPGVQARTYGRCYPEAEAYPDPSWVQSVVPLLYTIGAGEEYAVGDLEPRTDYYRAKTYSLETPGDHVLVSGQDRYVQVDLGHRIAFVRREDVEIV
ncbi:MAG: N-acetylmuramoyl-L-alanine amidase [Nocardioides sp.]|nr:N-acetylmuramoyl-L-alanine amidase [Nocardioides sp.]